MASPPPPSPPLPVGEDSWMDYIDQHTRHIDSLEKRIHVVELYRSAVSAEPGSIKVWVAFCEFFWSLHEGCEQPAEASWTQEELTDAREIFSLDAALHLWGEGHDATKYRLADSHYLWNRWIALEKELLDRTRTPEGVKRITHLYRNRLLVPHATWDDTSQMFSSFLSEYNPAGYESVMKDVTDRATEAKTLYGHRDDMELKLKKAARSGSMEAQKAAMAEYLHYEIANTKKERKNQAAAVQLGLGLFSRALTGVFVSDEATWTDFIVYVSHLRTVFSEGSNKDDDLLHLLPNSLDILQRAVQHCPWSGALWARYIFSGEEAGLAFSDMERIKHAATSSSQLDRDGMTAVVDMYAAWCGYLKRTAMHSSATDEAVDIADSGLVAALEAVQVWGERRFGDAYQGDPNFRLERILVQYLTEKHAAIDEARDQWKKLATRDLYASSYNFWLTYFMWEMLVFQAEKGKARSPTPGASAKGLRVPTLATQVLERAVYSHTIDWPERVMEVYLHHCNDYQTPDTLRRALDTVHKVKQGVAKRREREAADAAALFAAHAPAQQPPVDTSEPMAPQSPTGPKRKREGGSDDSAETSSKRAKNEPLDRGSTGLTQSDAQNQGELKRDRENTSVFVTNLPAGVTATKVKSYFKVYGHINSAHVQQDKDGKSSVAFIEFRSPEDVQSALIRDGKYFGEQLITVKPATNLTLFVTNYPPTADEAYIRELFKGCGDIFAVRLPSLRFNTHRRFCYITFRDLDSSAKATRLDGKLLEDRYKLIVNYSDPAAKRSRQGATEEGREVHVTSIDQDVDEDALREIFAKYGTIIGVRLLHGLRGQSRGSAFVVYEKKEEADKAVLELDNTKLRSKILKVEISTPSSYIPLAKDRGDTSLSPAPTSNDKQWDEAGPDRQDARNPGPREGGNYNGRRFTLLGIPDTVNLARVRALVERHGSVVELVLRSDHGGAIVELQDVVTAGKAQLALEGVEIDGRKLRVGTVADLFKEKPEKKGRGHGVRVGSVDAPGLMPPPPRTKRPVLGKGRAKRGLDYFGTRGPNGTAVSMPKANGEARGNGATDATVDLPEKKSNADFRRLFLSGGGGGGGGGDGTEGPHSAQNGH